MKLVRFHYRTDPLFPAFYAVTDDQGIILFSDSPIALPPGEPARLVSSASWVVHVEELSKDAPKAP